MRFNSLFRTGGDSYKHTPAKKRRRDKSETVSVEAVYDREEVVCWNCGRRALMPIGCDLEVLSWVVMGDKKICDKCFRDGLYDLPKPVVEAFESGVSGGKILLSSEIGGRSYGISVDSSDYDIGFVFSQGVANYLSVKSDRDKVIQRIADNYDVVGYDIYKFSNLLLKSNVAAYELLMSNKVYFGESIRKKFVECVIPDNYKSIFYHYFSHFQSMWSKVFANRGEVSVKEVVRILRLALCSSWVLGVILGKYKGYWGFMPRLKVADMLNDMRKKFSIDVKPFKGFTDKVVLFGSEVLPAVEVGKELFYKYMEKRCQGNSMVKAGDVEDFVIVFDDVLRRMDVASFKGVGDCESYFGRKHFTSQDIDSIILSLI